jgi:hypothetical protein
MSMVDAFCFGFVFVGSAALVVVFMDWFVERIKLASIKRHIARLNKRRAREDADYARERAREASKWALIGNGRKALKLPWNQFRGLAVGERGLVCGEATAGRLSQANGYLYLWDDGRGHHVAWDALPERTGGGSVTF